MRDGGAKKHHTQHFQKFAILPYPPPPSPLWGSTLGLHHSHKWMQCFAVATRGSLLHWRLTEQLCLLSCRATAFHFHSTATQQPAQFLTRPSSCTSLQCSHVHHRLVFPLLPDFLCECNIVVNYRFSELYLFGYSLCVHIMNCFIIKKQLWNYFYFHAHLFALNWPEALLLQCQEPIVLVHCSVLHLWEFFSKQY